MADLLLFPPNTLVEKLRSHAIDLLGQAMAEPPGAVRDRFTHAAITCWALARLVEGTP
jgi:hypothetical protein